ncbi:PLP-dependent transferase [Patescibacteria group bacterium]|nr:PLP-dependent transferase [Patescibacteria group bacterium]
MEETLADLKEDFGRLHSLYGFAYKTVEAFCMHLAGTKDSYILPTKTYLKSQADGLRGVLQGVSGELEHVLGNKALWSVSHVPQLIQKKKEYSDLLRTFHATLGGLLSAGNWQSPSFWHTATPQAGNETGKISVSANDYKRDMHADEKRYGQAFVKAYVDHPLRLAPFAFPTSSGMSAVATVLTSLRSRVAPGSVVMVGQASYFQNKWQLEKLFPGQVHYVDEFDTENMLLIAEKLQPSIVFLDSICGAESLAMPNLHVLIPKLSNILPSTSTLVLDNTGLATSYQPLHELPLKPLGGMHLVVVESLLKFHQFGFDRVSGGIIWAPVGSEQGLFEARMHLGTIMPDASVLAMPLPNRELFDARLARIGRNARLLAEKLDTALRHGGGVVSHVVHPSLPTYAGYEWSKNLSFQGPFVTLSFKEGKQSVSHYDAFVSRVTGAAKKAGIDIVGGTSFGFDTTRLYVTARYATGITSPFVRISVGTETKNEIEALARVFEEALA